MLPKKHRLSKNIIPLVLKKGKDFYSDNMRLKVFFDYQKNSAFSFVVSGKVSKRATERNKIKRRARNITNGIIKNVPVGVYCLVFFKPSIAGKKYAAIKDEIIALYKKAKIL